MFCPSCGAEERQRNQYCRSCGANLRAVRTALEKSDEITSSAASARDEIGRAIALKIKEVESVDLKEMAEDVLPEIEKFLESPEEKRLRRIRSGVVTASVGLGATLLFFIVSLTVKGDSGDYALALAGGGLTTFLIGLGLVSNGLLFTIPRKRMADHAREAPQRSEPDQSSSISGAYSKPAPADQPSHSPSVTEHTTHQLPDTR